MAYNPKDPYNFDQNNIYNPVSNFDFDNPFGSKFIIASVIIIEPLQGGVITHDLSIESSVISPNFNTNALLLNQEILATTISVNFLTPNIAFEQFITSLLINLNFESSTLKATFTDIVDTIHPNFLTHSIFNTMLLISTTLKPTFNQPTLYSNFDIETPLISNTLFQTPTIVYDQFITSQAITKTPNNPFLIFDQSLFGEVLKAQFFNETIFINFGYEIIAPTDGETLSSELTQLIVASTLTPITWNVSIDGSTVVSGASGSLTEFFIAVALDGLPHVVVLTGFDSNGTPTTVTNNYVTHDADAIPAVIVPVVGTVFQISDQTFEITDNLSGASLDRFSIGIGFQGSNIYDDVTVTSGDTFEITNIPSDGGDVFATLYSTLNGNPLTANYRYETTAFPAGLVDNFPGSFAIPLPLPGTPISIKFPSRQHTVMWDAYSSPVTGWRLQLIANTNFTQHTGEVRLIGDVILDTLVLDVNTLEEDYLDLPHLAESLILRLFIIDGSTTTAIDYLIPAVDSKIEISPITGTVQDGTFSISWDASFHTVTKWNLVVKQAGLIIYEIQDAPANVLSTTITGIKTDGTSIEVTLSWEAGAGNYSNSTVKNYATLSTPKLISPKFTLTGSTQTFLWSPEGFTIDQWRLDVGLSVDAKEFSAGEVIPGAILFKTIGNFPQDGTLIYTSLHYTQSGQAEKTLRYVNSSFFEPPRLIRPRGQTNYSHINADFSWSAGSATIDSFRLVLSDANNSSTIFHDSGILTSAFTSYVHPLLPINLEAVLATVFYKISTQDQTQSFSGSGTVQKQPIISLIVTGETESIVDISWSSEEVPVTSYDLLIRYTDDQSTISNLLGLLPAFTSFQFTEPANGRPFEAILSYDDGISVRTVITSGVNVAETLPTITTPEPSVLATAFNQTNLLVQIKTSIVWDAGTIGDVIDTWQIDVGSTVGGTDYFTQSAIPSIDRSIIIDGYPLDGSEVFVTLHWVLL